MDLNEHKIACEEEYLNYLEYCKENNETPTLTIEYFIEMYRQSLEKHHREQLRQKYDKSN